MRNRSINSRFESGHHSSHNMAIDVVCLSDVQMKRYIELIFVTFLYPIIKLSCKENTRKTNPKRRACGRGRADSWAGSGPCPDRSCWSGDGGGAGRCPGPGPSPAPHPARSPRSATSSSWGATASARRTAPGSCPSPRYPPSLWQRGAVTPEEETLDETPLLRRVQQTVYCELSSTRCLTTQVLFGKSTVCENNLSTPSKTKHSNKLYKVVHYATIA